MQYLSFLKMFRTATVRLFTRFDEPKAVCVVVGKVCAANDSRMFGEHLYKETIERRTIPGGVGVLLKLPRRNVTDKNHLHTNVSRILINQMHVRNELYTMEVKLLSQSIGRK